MKTNLLIIPKVALAFVVLGCQNPAAPPIGAAITLLAIPGVTAPVKGASPVTTTAETDQYTGTVSWSPEAAPAFAAVTEYTATITLTAKAGYTLAGVAADSFTVAGATVVSHGADSGVITAVFPATFSFALTMLTIPAGNFSRDGTTTNVSVITRPYGMSACEITRAQFEELFGEDPGSNKWSTSKDDPVQTVTWYRAIAFCNKLSLAEGLEPVYAVEGVDFITLTFGQIPGSSNDAWTNATATWTNNGYRLPTEMEWMWAAMGAPADGRDDGVNVTGYAKAFAGSTGSNSLDDYAWHVSNNNGSNTTHPVGTKLPNELGLFDMSGNVQELCWDRWAASYCDGELTDYRGPDSGTSRVRRGGSFDNYNTENLSVGSRMDILNYLGSMVVGFRVVRN